MDRYWWGGVLVAASIAAGCASAPEQTAQNAGEAPTGEVAVAAAAGAPVAEAPEAAVVVDATELPPPGSEVRCREMLKQGSNVIVRYCMTLADWKKFERRQEIDAQEIVRALQGSRYR